jgi:hypothetical protein
MTREHDAAERSRLASRNTQVKISGVELSISWLVVRLSA